MQDKKVSIVIPVRTVEELKNIDGIKKINYPQELIEVIVVIGNNPSLQRNEGVKRASGDIILFLDNDSEPDNEIINNILKTYNSYDCIGVGGPCLLSKNSNIWGKIFQLLLSSYYTVFDISYRYSKKGKSESVDDSRLILCNFSIIREEFIKSNGFNINLYPNEENEFIKRLLNNGYKFYRNPEVIVYKPQRKNIKEFLKMIFRNGMGRAKQTRIAFASSSLKMFLPILFILYLIVLPVLKSPHLFIPFVFYLVIAFLNSILIVTKIKNLLFLPIILLLIFFIHIFYALGLITGLILPLRWSDKDYKADAMFLKRFDTDYVQ